MTVTFRHAPIRIVAVLAIGGILAACGGAESGSGSRSEQPAAPASWGLVVIHAASPDRFGADGMDVHDLNGDGYADVVVGWEEQGHVWAYLNPAGGEAWGKVRLAEKCEGVENVRCADLDGDGHVDVAFAAESPGSRIGLLWSSGADLAEVGASRTAIAASRGSEWMDVLAGDIDGDGRTDAIGTSKYDADGAETPAALVWFRAPEAPRTEPWPLHVIDEASWIMGAEVLDLDGDGDLDIVTCDRNREINWYENHRAEGSALPAWRTWRIGTVTRARQIRIVDLTGDGIPEIVIAGGRDQDGTSLRWFEGPPDPRVHGWTAHDVGPEPGRSGDLDRFTKAKCVAVGDVDGDGRIDLVVASSRHLHRLFKLSYRSTVRDARWVSTELYAREPTKFNEIDLVDLDRDGDLDLLFTNEYAEGGVLYLRNPLVP